MFADVLQEGLHLCCLVSVVLWSGKMFAEQSLDGNCMRKGVASQYNLATEILKHIFLMATVIHL